MPWWVWLLALAVATGVASEAQASPGTKPGGGSPRLALLYQQAQRAGVDADWQRFLAAVAHHESRWYTSAHLESPSEVAASAKAYDRNAGQLGGCPFARSAYVIGSGGWYGFLPANGIVSAFRGTPAICMDPAKIFEPWESTLMAIAYAKNLQKWKSFQRSDRTWLALNRGWSVPGAMDVVRPSSDGRFLKGLRAAGIPESFASQKVTPLPPDWHAYSYLTGAATA